MTMKPKAIVLVILSLLVVSIVCCKSPKKQGETFTQSKQQKAEDAIKNWMLNSKDYPHYKPIVFGDVAPRYEKTNRTLQLSIQIGEEEERSKETGNTQKLDSLLTIMEQHKGELLGYIIAHKFQETNLAGEKINRELLFFIDTSFRVASALTPESFDFILDEKVFFRLDSVNQ